MNKAKFAKISLLLAALSLSIIIPIFAVSVTAKKEGYTRSEPVYINDAVPYCSWADWSAEPWLKGSGTEEDPYMIKDLVIEVSGSQFAMMIHDSDAYFKIMKCTFSNGGIEGQSAGLVLANTKNGVIFKNRFIDNMGAGIALIGTINNTIQKNLCSENGVGIYIEWGMYTTIKQNDCYNNFDSGIVIASAHKNIIEKNDCVENANAGIALINVGELEHSPKDNIIYTNNLENNQLGIYLNDADKNDILRNTIVENGYGILVAAGSENNTVYHNNIVDNSIQAVDFQPTNNWHHPYMEEGNFWSDAPFGRDEHPFVEKNGWEFMTPIEEEILSSPSNRLGAGRIVNASETSYIYYGVIQLFSERVEGEAYPPYSVTTWFYGMEVVLEDSLWIFREETIYGEPGLLQMFYMVIPPYGLLAAGLTLGYHEYLVEITWYNSGVLQSVSFTTGFTLI